MMLLALIPAAALLAVIVLCLSTKQKHSATCDAIAKRAEQQRQEKLSLDAENDCSLVNKVVSGKKALGELLARYAEKRREILPEVRRQEPAHWTNDDLINFLKRWKFALAVKAGRKLLFQTALGVLSVVALAVALAAWRYSALSDHPGTAAQNSAPKAEVDPFADASTAAH